MAFLMSLPVVVTGTYLTFLAYGLGAHTVLFIYAILVLGYGAWSEFRLNQRQVEIRLTSRKVHVCERTLFGRRKISTFSIDDFTSVASYIGPGKLASVQVDLLTKDATNGLLACQFRPDTDGGEPEDAQNLRARLATTLSLVDQGFLGGCFRPRRLEPDNR